MTVERDGDARQGIQSVENAMTVLIALEGGGGPMTLGQIAAGAGMQPSKAHRYLVSLGRVALVSQDPVSGRYDLGPAVRRLGVEALRRMDAVGIASGHLPGLRDRTGQTVGMHVWGEHGPVLIRWENGVEYLPITTRIGATIPLVTTSAGRVFLAHLPDAMTAPVVRANRRNGLTDLGPEELERLKEEVRRDGYATTANAMVPGIRSIAAPVFSETSLPVVVVMGVPIKQAKPALLRSLTAELLRTTAAISAELGHVAKA